MAKKPLQKNNKRTNKKPAPLLQSKISKPNNRNQGSGRKQVHDQAVPVFSIKSLAKDSIFLHGRHPVEAALKNKRRECLRLLGSKKALNTIDRNLIRPSMKVQEISDAELSAFLVSDSPHQGILIEVRPLPSLDIQDIEPIHGQKNIILMLDQVTDPHNVGACIRSAAALGARAIITQDRNSPSESGVLARSAAGGLEVLPWLQVANLAQALDTLKAMGYWHIGLDGDTDKSIRDVSLGDNVVLIMGSEGKGMRPLTRKHCDIIAKIPMTGLVESLNVSNAAAIALHEIANT
jgi:23S rRNA (guanosine2251-2'-O)-methyltransferase